MLGIILVVSYVQAWVRVGITRKRWEDIYNCKERSSWDDPGGWIPRLEDQLRA